MWSQIKYDGIKFHAGMSDEQVSIYSESCRDLNHLEHIRSDLQPIMKSIKEIYPDSVGDIIGVLVINRGVKQFQETIHESIIEKYNPDIKVTAVIIDVLITGTTYEQRWNILSEHISTELSTTSLQLIDYQIHDNIGSTRRECIRVCNLGYEGILLVDPTCTCANYQTETMVIGNVTNDVYTIPEKITFIELQKIDDYMRLISIEPEHVLDCINIDVLRKILPDSTSLIKYIDVRFPIGSSQRLEQWDVVAYRNVPTQMTVRSYIYNGVEQKIIIQAELH